MVFWENKRTAFIITFMGVGIIFLFLFGFNFVRIAKTTTDENIFTDIPSKVIFNENPYNNTHSKDIKTDSISDLTGFFLLAVNGQPVKSSSEALNLIKKFKDSVELKCFNPKYLCNSIVKINPSSADDSLFRDLKFGALITNITQNGASDRAGLKVGDIILSINNKSFKDIYQADFYMKDNTSGTNVKYLILRNGSEIEYTVKLARFGITFINLLSFLYAVLILVFAFILILNKSEYLSARMLIYTLLALSYIIGMGGIRILNDFFDIYKNLTMNISFCLSLALIFHLSIYFPREQTNITKRKYIVRLPYIFLGLAFLYMIVSMFRWFSDGFLFGITYTSLQFLYFVTIKIIFREHKISNNSKVINITNFANGTYAFILMMVTLRPFVIKYFLYYFQLYDLIVNLVFVNIIILLPAIYLFEILKHKLFDTKLRIRKNIQFIITTTLWQTFCIIVLGLSLWGISYINPYIPYPHLTGTTIEFMDLPQKNTSQESLEKFALILISLLISAFIWKLKKYGQYKINRKYHREEFDYRKASTELTELLAQNKNVKELAESLISELIQLFHVKRMGIVIFKNEEKIIEQVYSGFKSQSFEEICQATAFKFAESIRWFSKIFGVEYLPEPLKTYFKEYKFRYVVPIRSKDRIAGALIIGEKLSELAFKKEDFEFLTSITGQIAVAIDNAFLVEELAYRERLKHELEIARRIQLASLPQATPKMEGIDISGASAPALEVGGDFYDYLENGDDALTIIVGDVSGKGTSAALYMSKVQGIMRTLHEFDLSPRKLLISTNQLLYKYLDKSYFITAIGARLNSESNTITLARAGHLPLFYFNSLQDKTEKITTKGMLLGFTKDSLFERTLEEISFPYNKGDVFVFVTDGIIEARNSNNMEYGDEMLMSIIDENCKNSADEIKENIMSSVYSFSNEVSQLDDITIVVAKII